MTTRPLPGRWKCPYCGEPSTPDVVADPDGVRWVDFECCGRASVRDVFGGEPGE